jgi:PHD/YefM family antitoxin component YafN of YafNO toxin-antitoxin module
MSLKIVDNKKFITISKEEYEILKATIETLEDAEVMEQLKKSWKASSKSLEDIKKEIGI